MAPDQLQQKVFFDLQYNLARHGRENLQFLKPSNFKFRFDDAGREYAEICINESTKNHPTTDLTVEKQRPYATSKLSCPVKTLKLYLSKLPQDIDILYCKSVTRKSFNIDEETWYTPKPLGLSTLGRMMPIISEKLSLSQRYTNHNIRANVVTLLSQNGFQSREIMRLSWAQI